MDELNLEQRQQALQQLAAHIHRWRLGGVAQTLLGMGKGASVVASQLLLVLQPITPIAPWRSALHTYAVALEDEASWQELIGYLQALES